MFAPPLTITIEEDEALGLIVRHGMIGYGVPDSGEICFWLPDEFYPPVGQLRGPWKLCKVGVVAEPPWRADGA